MKINKIKNAYIKNKPSYNYQIKDDQGNLIAKGHLMSARDKQKISKLFKYDIDASGNTKPNIDS